MPELPDLACYLSALGPRVLGRRLEAVRRASPFLLRTVDPPIERTFGMTVGTLRRIGKRITFGLDGDLWLVLHLMTAGRLHWREPGTALSGRNALAAFDFADGALVLTEAGSKKRAALHVVAADAALAGLDPGGLEPLEIDRDTFAGRLTESNHTLKRALTDPRVFAGIGNAYSDEILHAARLSPVAMTTRLDAAAVTRLFEATQAVLAGWSRRLREETGDGWPKKVTAFHPGMAVHGRYGKPCPTCGTTVQRIRYADNETNYCPACQTGGRLLADRGLSRLLKGDWPRTLEELERLRRPRAG